MGAPGPASRCRACFPPTASAVLADDVGDGTSSVAGAQLIANSDFQNGPDSIVLRTADTILDAVGYGVFGVAEIFAGEGSGRRGRARGLEPRAAVRERRHRRQRSGLHRVGRSDAGQRAAERGPRAANRRAARRGPARPGVVRARAGCASGALILTGGGIPISLPTLPPSESRSITAVGRGSTYAPRSGAGAPVARSAI